MKFIWEEIWNNKREALINPDHFEQTARAKVPGGWLVTHITACHGEEGKQCKRCSSFAERRPSMVFVPDPNHLWKDEV